MKLAWTKLALFDLENAYEFISKDNPTAARHVLESIEHGLEFLTRHPEGGRLGRVTGTRELVVPGIPFLIIYRFKSNQIEIISVLHSSRKWPEIDA